MREVIGWISVLRGRGGGGLSKVDARAEFMLKFFLFRKKLNAPDGRVARTKAGSMPATDKKFGENNGEIQHVAEVIS